MFCYWWEHSCDLVMVPGSSLPLSTPLHLLHDCHSRNVPFLCHLYHTVGHVAEFLVEDFLGTE